MDYRILSMKLDGVFRVMYRRKPMQSGKMYRIILLMAVVSAVLGLITARQCDTIILLPFLPSIAVCAVVFVLCFSYIRVKNYQKYGSVWKPKEKDKEPKILYVDDDIDEVSSPYEKAIFQSFSELYDKKNAKRRKKNKPALTAEEFMEFLEKENEKFKRDSRRMPVIWGIICIITTVVMAIMGGFSDILDGCIFFAILAGLMTVIYYFVFGKFVYGKILSERVRLLAKCRKNNKTILDYADYTKKGSKPS